jgi:putative ATPase
MESLFPDAPEPPASRAPAPLAERMRPRTFDEFVGQEDLLGPGQPLREAIDRDLLQSIILWGPPGTGKTTLARIIADTTRARFVAFSAVLSGIKEIRDVMAEAEHLRRTTGRRTIVFIDEIHRFNKAQQDFLLPYVEDGTLVLIGATTENPSFEVIPALMSRSRVYVLEPLSADEIKQVIGRGAEELGVALPDDSVEFLAQYANGDARQALNLLEAAASLYAPDGGELSVGNLKDALQSKHLRYDQGGEEHYNTISAYIKSMRASNPDAALYYLARMVDAGEDPKFIARRMVIFASEDVGMADSNALAVANDVFRAVETIGYPECAFHLAHGTVYMATAPKDRSAGDAYFTALEDVQQQGNLPIPLNLRNAPTKLMKELGYGKGYERYTDEDLLPEKLRGRKYYGG